jgi:hypothetical protein
VKASARRRREHVSDGSADDGADDAEHDGPEDGHLHVHHRLRYDSGDETDQDVPDEVEHKFVGYWLFWRLVRILERILQREFGIAAAFAFIEALGSARAQRLGCFCFSIHLRCDASVGRSTSERFIWKRWHQKIRGRIPRMFGKNSGN